MASRARSGRVSSSPIGRRSDIKLLESEYGQVLLVRSKPVQPTPAGRRLPYRPAARDPEGEAERPSPGDQGPSADDAGSASADGHHLDRAISQVVEGEFPLVLDYVVDDQDHTHALLANGEVLWLRERPADPMRGCACASRGDALSCLASPAFRARHSHLTSTRAALRAPAIVWAALTTYGRASAPPFRSRDRAIPTAMWCHSSGRVRLVRRWRASATASCPNRVREALAEGRLVDLAPEQRSRWVCSAPLADPVPAHGAAAAALGPVLRGLEAVACCGFSGSGSRPDCPSHSCRQPAGRRREAARNPGSFLPRLGCRTRPSVPW